MEVTHHQPATTADEPRYRTPPNGPSDPRLYLIVGAVIGCEEAGIGPDGNVWLIKRLDPQAAKSGAPIDPAEIDELVALGWLSLDDGPETIAVTAAGRYWLDRFIKANERLLGDTRRAGGRSWRKWLDRTFSTAKR